VQSLSPFPLRRRPRFLGRHSFSALALFQMMGVFAGSVWNESSSPLERAKAQASASGRNDNSAVIADRTAIAELPWTAPTRLKGNGSIFSGPMTRATSLRRWGLRGGSQSNGPCMRQTGAVAPDHHLGASGRNRSGLVQCERRRPRKVSPGLSKGHRRPGLGRSRVRQNIFAYQLCKQGDQLLSGAWFLVPPYPGELGQ
jgi:hypothetical protein